MTERLVVPPIAHWLHEHEHTHIQHTHTAYLVRGRIHYANEHWQAAVKDLSTAVKLQPNLGQGEAALVLSLMLVKVRLRSFLALCSVVVEMRLHQLCVYLGLGVTKAA